MIDGIRLSAAGARVQSLRHDVIANNLANVNTVGFARQLAIIGAQGDAAAQRRALVGGAPDLVATPQETGHGTLTATERPGDLALDGEGYFAVSDGRRQLYTRAGHFEVDAAGFLVTSDHRFRVQDQSGRPIRIDRNLPFSVTDDGQVLQNGAPVGDLAVVTFSDPRRLTSLGEGLLAAPDGATPALTRAATVHQGYLEHSTVEAVRELVAMMEAYRAYEANVNLIGQQDAALGRLIESTGRLM